MEGQENSRVFPFPVDVPAEGEYQEREDTEWEMISEAVAKQGRVFERVCVCLLERYKHAVYKRVFSLVRNRADAEDVMFVAFGKAFIKLSRFKRGNSFGTWMYKIAGNTARAFLRWKKNRPLVYGMPEDIVDARACREDNVHYLAGRHTTPEEETNRRQYAEIVRKNVKRLEEHYRRVVEMYYFEEKTCAEIGEELGMPANTVKTHLYRARKCLDEAFKYAGLVRI